MAEENEVILAWGDAQGKGRTTLAQLKKWINSPEENAEKIADFVYWRLYERYIRPFEVLIEHEEFINTKENKKIQIDDEQDDEQDDEPNDEQKNTQDYLKVRIGFAIVANMCPVIEALEAFKLGKERFYNEKKLDNVMSYEDAFIDFFEKEKEKERERDTLFNVPENFGKEFYKNIRCRILHQGGTGGGWKIKHIGDNRIIDVDAKIIDARKFLVKTKEILGNYRDGLKGGSEDINNCVTKCKAIISNC